jgi:hypothetical protein
MPSFIMECSAHIVVVVVVTAGILYGYTHIGGHARFIIQIGWREKDFVHNSSGRTVFVGSFLELCYEDINWT